MSKYYTIGQLAMLAGISTKTLRVYLYENISRENMLLEQKRLLEKKREQLNTVIAHVERAVKACQMEELDGNTFLKSLGTIVKNQCADDLVGRLRRHADEPRGWSRFVFDTAEDFVDYIQQVCRPVREQLELRRREFIEFLEQFRDEQGQFTFERDTYLYCCRKSR